MMFDNPIASILMNEETAGEAANVGGAATETTDVTEVAETTAPATDPPVVVDEVDKYLSLLEGDDLATDDIDADLAAEYEEGDSVGMDASNNNERLGNNMAPIKPIVKIINNKPKVILPLGFLSRITLKENGSEDSAGYYIGLKRKKLRFEFTGYKNIAADANTGHTHTIEAVKGDLDLKVRNNIINKQLGFINDLATAYGMTSRLDKVDAIARKLTLDYVKQEKLKGNNVSQEEFMLEKYHNTFNMWYAIFTKGNNGKPFYLDNTKSDTEVNAVGQPVNVIPLRLHILVYRQKWDFSWSPCLEKVISGAKSGLVPDIARNQYEKTENTDAPAAGKGGGGSTAGMGAGGELTVELPDDVDFEEVTD